MRKSVAQGETPGSCFGDLYNPTHGECMQCTVSNDCALKILQRDKQVMLDNMVEISDKQIIEWVEDVKPAQEVIQYIKKAMRIVDTEAAKQRLLRCLRRNAHITYEDKQIKVL